ncbi:MAG: DNA mismatch repair endonuclease MutL [Candidatus Omnitrophica bacterium]|nr:DNA mismatch repair endonuclease MutL [Candidatus Omnitrophota bacterium]
MTESKIHLLSEEVIGKISAGEVVERPASVVKELVENAIDAGAGSIRIEIRDAGRSMIRVADNGEGMTGEDAKLACMRHATSKIKDITDIEHARTLGFRGEALASIAAVARLEITSYDGIGDSAVYLYLEGGQIRKIRPAPRAKGTTVEVRGLFYNVPARRKFLKKESTELAAIVETVGRFVVSNPDIEFRLNQGTRDLLHVTGDMDLLARVRSALGGDVADHMVEVAFSSGGYAVSGYAGRPASTRKDTGAQMFFVNKRFVRSRLLSHSVQDAYRSLLERGRYPSAVLFLSIDPSEMDVNVHPTKLLVKFDDEKIVRKTVVEAVKNAFEGIKPTFIPEKVAARTPVTEKQLPEMPVSPREQAVQDEFIYDIPAKKPEEHGVREETSADLPLAGTVPAAGKRLFQIGNCYIVRINGDKITVTDQHAAHERILYEYFSEAAENRSRDVQNLLFPARLDLSAGESVVMEKLIDKFRLLGFQIDLFGENSYAVQAVPAVLKDGDIKAVVYDVLSDLVSRDLDRIDPLEELIKLTSCRAAIKAGDRLNEQEMEVLLARLDNCDLPFTCPHGRPTSFDITVRELEKRFRRT